MPRSALTTLARCLFLVPGALAAALALDACAPQEVGLAGGRSSALSTAPGPSINPWKELLLVDETVVNGPRVQNERLDGSAGPWSIRHLLEEMAAGAADPVDFTERFFSRFHDTSVNEFEMCDRAAVEMMLSIWRTGADKIDLRRAPFRLLAIANREDITFDGSPGELRLVYGVNGFGRERMTLIFEYKLPAKHTRAQWAQRFHQLGALPFGEPLNAALEQITEEIVTHQADPDASCQVNGSCISQVRANERLFNDGIHCDFLNWELREFHLVPVQGASLVPAAVRQTPHWTKNGQDDLAQLLVANRDAVLAHQFVFPDVPHSQGGFLGGTAIEGFIDAEAFRWDFPQPEVDPPLRDAFVFDTCNGCHHQRDDTLTGFYHIEPGSLAHGDLVGPGLDRVSDFVKNVDMPVRICVLQDLLESGSCSPRSAPRPGRVH